MKLLICDMSGIVSINGKKNNTLLETISNLKNYDYSFCTGKGYLGAYETLINNNLKIPFICENGSLIMTKNGDILKKYLIEKQNIIKLINNITSEEFEFISFCNLETNKYQFLNNKEKINTELNSTIFFNEKVFYDKKSFLEAALSHDIVRVVCRAKNLSNIEYLNENFEVTMSEGEYYTFNKLNISKKSGVLDLVKYLNVQLEDIILIGNDINDISMFELEVGYKIAVGKKCPVELLNLADINIDLEELPNLIKQLDSNCSVLGHSYKNNII